MSGRFIKKRLRSPESASPKVFFYDRFGNQRGIIRKLYNCIIKISPTEKAEVCNDQSANQKKFMDMITVGGDLAMGEKVSIKGRYLMKRKWNVLCSSTRGGKWVC